MNNDQSELTSRHVIRLPDLSLTSITQLFERIAGYDRADLDRAALTFYAGSTRVDSVSYAELHARVLQLAGYLHARMDVRRGDRIAFLTLNSFDVPIFYLALMILGAVVVPLNPTTDADEWNYVLKHAQAKGLFVAEALLATIPPFHGLRFQLSVEATAASARIGAPIEAPQAQDSSDEPAILLYTSGTTGRPKGVALSQYNLLANAAALTGHLAVLRSVFYNIMPLYHAHAVGFGLMNSLMSESHLVFAHGLDVIAYKSVLNSEQVEVTSLVPNLVPLVLRTGLRADDVPALRFVYVSAAPLTVSSATRFEQETGLRLIHAWGLSEYHFAACLRVDDTLERHRRLLLGSDVTSVGGVLPGTELRVCDEAGQPLPDGEAGELWVRGHSTMLGYLNDAAATRNALVDGWLRTGDKGVAAIDEGERVFYIVDVREAARAGPRSPPASTQ